MAPEERLVPLESSVSEALRLLEDAARSWAKDPAMPADLGTRLRDEVRTGAQHGRLLPSPAGGASGLAVWRTPTPVGRRALIVLDAGFQNGPTLGRFVDALRADRSEGPLVSLEDVTPGVASAVSSEVLSVRGFRKVTRIDMYYSSSAPLPRAPPDPPGLRELVPEDEGAVARLLGESYADFPLDLALFRTALDPEEDLRNAARYILGGELGAWWRDASFGVPDPGQPNRLLGAVIVNEHHGALITELGVAPDARGRGLGRALLRKAIEGTRRRGVERVRLVVTLANRRAHSLYRSMGFVEDPRNIGSLWLDPKELGLSQLDSPFEPRSPDRSGGTP